MQVKKNESLKGKNLFRTQTVNVVKNVLLYANNIFIIYAKNSFCDFKIFRYCYIFLLFLLLNESKFKKQNYLDEQLRNHNYVI